MRWSAWSLTCSLMMICNPFTRIFFSVTGFCIAYVNTLTLITLNPNYRKIRLCGWYFFFYIIDIVLETFHRIKPQCTVFCSILNVVPYVDTIALVVIQKAPSTYGIKDLVKNKVQYTKMYTKHWANFFKNELTSIAMTYLIGMVINTPFCTLKPWVDGNNIR